ARVRLEDARTAGRRRRGLLTRLPRRLQLAISRQRHLVLLASHGRPDGCSSAVGAALVAGVTRGLIGRARDRPLCRRHPADRVSDPVADGIRPNAGLIQFLGNGSQALIAAWFVRRYAGTNGFFGDARRILTFI